MKLFKFTIIVSAFVLISAVAWAGNSPEYDAVGRDLDNFPWQTDRWIGPDLELCKEA